MTTERGRYKTRENIVAVLENMFVRLYSLHNQSNQYCSLLPPCQCLQAWLSVDYARQSTLLRGKRQSHSLEGRMRMRENVPLAFPLHVIFTRIFSRKCAMRDVLLGWRAEFFWFLLVGSHFAGGY